MTLPTRPMTRVATMLALVCARQRARSGNHWRTTAVHLRPTSR